MRRPVLAVASLYADPLHVGHVRYLEAARALGDRLMAVVNTDAQAVLKKGRPFMPELERLAVVRALRCVDYALLAVDTDRTVRETLALVCLQMGRGVDIVFANGGDVRSDLDCREAETCRRLGIRMEFGVGGFDKVQSSSALVAGCKTPSPN